MRTRLITQIGISLALATILHIITIYHLPQGGSITPGSMVPLFIMALYYGPKIGIITGLLFGIINLILNPFIVHPVQLLLDYPLAFMVLGVAGFFKNPIIGALVGLTGRFMFHFISGIVFFSSYAPQGMSPYLYSVIVNGLFMGVEGIICIVVISLLPLNQLFDILEGKGN